jgi:hypothetical protein
MKKIVLAFPSKESMAEYVLAFKIVELQADFDQLTLTGYISEECQQIAFRDYGAFIPKPPDFVF